MIKYSNQIFIIPILHRTFIHTLVDNIFYHELKYFKHYLPHLHDFEGIIISGDGVF